MKRGPKPKPPPDDSPGPVLTTPRRLSADLERLAGILGEVEARIRRDAAYVDSKRFEELADELHATSARLGTLAGDVAVGKVPVIIGRDPTAGDARYPLFPPQPTQIDSQDPSSVIANGHANRKAPKTPRERSSRKVDGSDVPRPRKRPAAPQTTGEGV